MQPNQSQQLDPDAVNLAKAIRQTESGGDFTAKGKSGEYGAYQYTEPTWAKDSAAAGVNVPLAQATKEQQNEVAYNKIKSLKDAGHNVGEIASIWNSGDAQAYTGKFSTGKPATGINSYGVKYDVPAYAKSVATAYQKLKVGQQVQADPNNPSSTAAPDTPKLQGNPLVEGAKAVGNFLFPIVGDIAGDIHGDNTKSVLQQGADLGLSALPFIPGLGEVGEGVRGGELAAEGASKIAPGILSKIAGSTVAKGVGLGAAAGGLQSVSQGDNSAKGILGSAALGGATGGLLGGAGSLLTKASEVLPKRMIMSYLPKLSEKNSSYALTKSLGSPASMLEESNRSIDKLGPQLGAAISSKANSYVQPSGEEILNTIASKFNTGGVENISAEDVANDLTKLARNKKGIINKLLSGQDLKLSQLHELNSAIGNSTFKSVFDDPAVKANKEIGNEAYHVIGNIIKTAAPDSGPIFDELSKEYALNKALQSAVRSGEKSKAIHLTDIVSLLAGLTAGGPLGAAAAFAGEKALRSPTVGLKTAGLISKLGKPIVRKIGKQVIPQVARGVSGLISATKPNQ